MLKSARIGCNPDNGRKHLRGHCEGLIPIYKRC
jgi:hypothetical protein